MRTFVSPRIIVTLIAVLVAAAIAAAAAGVARADAGSVAAVPVAGTADGGATFAGTMDVTGFAVQDGQVVALGTVSGVVTDASGNTLGTVSGAAAVAPVQQASSDCTLVSISIGAIDINVAGQVTVHLDPIGLNVGLSGLLGSILCGLLGTGGGGVTPPPLPA